MAEEADPRAHAPAGGMGGEAATGVAADSAQGPAAGGSPRGGAEALRLSLVHLYPDLLNIYGDRGNVLALARRAWWRGIALRVRAVHAGEPCDLGEADLVCIGGGEDAKQVAAAADLVRRGPDLHDAVRGGLPVLAVCGGYQLLGHHYQPAAGPRLAGVGLFDAHTVAGEGRMVGNVVVDSAFGTLVGFENHSGRTFLGPGCAPLGRVRTGRGGGNNGADGGEGARAGNCIGTYLHGSLLPKNPALADFLLHAAVVRRYGERAAAAALPPLDDAAEWAAHRASERLRSARGRR